jgi:integrase
MLLVEAAVSGGVVGETKTRWRRTVRLLPPLGADLVEWRLRAGRPPDDALVFPGHDGRPWSPAACKNWHRRIFRPATAAAGLTGARPYDLRHSFVSLLIAEGHNVVEVARQAGHSPKVALDRYAHVFEEFDPTERIDVAECIRNGREELRRRARQPTLFDVA